MLRLIAKLRHSDVINDFKDPILPKYSQKNVLPWQYKAFLSAKILCKKNFIISKKASKVCKDSLRNNVTVKSLLSWMAPFRISAVSRMCCHGNMNNPILLKFATKVQLDIFNKIGNFVEIDLEMTSQ